MTDATGRPLVQRVEERITAEHQLIRAVNHRLQACTDIATLLECATELRAMLEAHFAVEEEPNGFFETAYAQAPRHHARLDHLRQEHQVMLADLDALIERARESLGLTAALCEQARALGHRLAQHEAAEDHVLLDTMDTDLGEGEGG